MNICMVTNRIKEILFPMYSILYCRHSQKRHTSEVCNSGNSIGILYSISDYGISGKVLELLCGTYKTSCLAIDKSSIKNTTQGQEAIAFEDISIFGLPHKQLLRDFLCQRFDCLINLTNAESPLVKILLAKSAARYKVGVYSDYYYRVYDLSIKLDKQEPSDAVEKLKIILRYVKNLG